MSKIARTVLAVISLSSTVLLTTSCGTSCNCRLECLLVNDTVTICSGSFYNETDYRHAVDSVVALYGAADFQDSVLSEVRISSKVFHNKEFSSLKQQLESQGYNCSDCVK